MDLNLLEALGKNAGFLLSLGLVYEVFFLNRLKLSSGESLLHLIDDILDFSKIEAGKIEKEIISFNLLNLLESVSELLFPKAAAKGLNFSIFIDPQLPLLLKGDMNKIRQVLFNLLGNAVKFTGSGGIVFEARLISESSEKISVIFSVEDTGIGISPENQQKLFKPFTQANESMARKFGGTGLGLAISKQLVELMEGTLFFMSRENEGSRFWFNLKFEKILPERKIKDDLFLDLKKRNILFIDKDKFTASSLSPLFREWNSRIDFYSENLVLRVAPPFLPVLKNSSKPSKRKKIMPYFLWITI